MSKKVPQMIEDQVQFWMHKNLADQHISFPAKKNPVITISREFGAKGAALAQELSNETGFKVWDEALFRLISDEIGGNEEFVKSLDESRRGLLEDTIFGFMNKRSTNLNYLIILVRAVRTLERFGNNIIVGRGANYICRSSDSFHVRVVCPLKTRIDQYTLQENIPKTEADSIIRQKDQERANFTKYNFNREITNPSDYDLIVNSGTYSIKELARIVINAYEIKCIHSVKNYKKAKHH